MPHNPFYQTKEWRDAREKYLRLRPYCVICALIKKKRLAVEVDHIVAMEKGGAPFAPANLRGLCKTHHGQKTFQLDNGRAGAYKKPFVVTGPDGFPIHIEK